MIVSVVGQVVIPWGRGTERQHVTDDYAERLHIGQVECEVSDCVLLSDSSTTNCIATGW